MFPFQWNITKVYDGGTIVRIDARTKNHIPDKDNYFSRWYSIKYACLLYTSDAADD